MNEEYILAVMESNGKINVTATTEIGIQDARKVRDELLVRRQDEPELQAILKRLSGV